MSYDWDAVRAGWESARHAADSGLGATGDAQLARGRFGLALRPVTITGSPGTGKTVLYDALTGT